MTNLRDRLHVWRLRERIPVSMPAMQSDVYTAVIKWGECTQPALLADNKIDVTVKDTRLEICVHLRVFATRCSFATPGYRTATPAFVNAPTPAQRARDRVKPAGTAEAENHRRVKGGTHGTGGRYDAIVLQLLVRWFLLPCQLGPSSGITMADCNTYSYHLAERIPISILTDFRAKAICPPASKEACYPRGVLHTSQPVAV